MASHTYNSSNELTAAGSTTFTYDQNGNTLSKNGSSGQTTYAWDVENRLTSVTLPNGSGVVTFKYDPFGRRIERSGPSGTTLFAYDGANVTEELTASGAPSMRYVQGAGIDEPLAESGTSIDYFAADGLGSITSLEDTTGTPQATFVYGAFGVLKSSTGSLTDSYRYTAREYDQDTGLYYYRARYYDPNTGRFISEDPIGFAGGINVYRYVHNLPTSAIDPSGLSAKKKCETKPCDAQMPSDPDAALLAHLIAGEATWRKNSTSEMAAIGSSIMNRLDYLQKHSKVKPSFFGGTAVSVAGLVTPGQYGSIRNPMWNLADNVSSMYASDQAHH